MRSKKERQALIVLGMHRSGTSALSGVLSALGAQPPKTLMPPTKDNPKGYWESVAMMGLHDEILASAGTSWSDWDRFNIDWLDSAVAERFRDKLSDVLEKEYGQSEVFLVKDPRICRLLPLWLAVLDDLHISPRIVLSVRHPLEVARSLAIRNEFGNRRSLLIWLRHVLDAEYHSRDRQRVFVDYETLLEDWRPQVRKISKALGIKWPKWSGKVEAGIDSFLSGELRHQVAAENQKQGSGLHDWVNQTHQALKNLVAAGPDDSEAISKLDRVRDDLDRSCSIYASVLAEHELHTEEKLNQVNAQLDEKIHAHDELVSNIGSARKDILYRDEQVAALEKQVQDGVAARKHEAEEHAAGMRLEISRLDSEYQKRMEEIITLHSSEIEQLKQASSRVEDAHHKRVEELKALHSSEIEQLEQVSSSIEESLRVRTAELAKLTAITFELEDAVAGHEKKAEFLQSRLKQSIDEQAMAQAQYRKGADALRRERNLRSSADSNAKAKLHAVAHALAVYRLAMDEREEQMRTSAIWRASKALQRMKGASQAGAATQKSVLENEIVRNSGLFDCDWYLDRYPDVRVAGFDPVEHYLNHGAQEGRDPGPGFNTKAYLDTYEDVAASGLNPLLHYIWYGIGQGRSPLTIEEGRAAG